MPTKLTEKAVKDADPPAKGATSIWDTEIKGFGVRIFAPTLRHPEGARSFFVNYRVNGVERRHTLGEYPTWTVLAARNEAKALRRRINQGEDVARDKREARDAPTVNDLAERYRREHLPRKAPVSAKADSAMIDAYILPALGSRRVVDIHFGDIRALHEKITADGRPVRANRVLAVASKMFSLSLLPKAGENEPWRDAAMGNPCRGVERNREEGRERFFSTAELARLSDALAAQPPSPAVNCLKLIMLTGCRPGEAMRATWAEFAEAGYWDKPSAHVKQRKRHRVPLSPAAIELISRLRNDRAGDSGFVFPSNRGGGPIRELWRVWKPVAAEAGIPDGLVYTLRHSFASIGAGGGLSLQIIGRLLGHTLARTTERYAHLGDDPLREAAAKIGAAIAGGGKGDANVVPLPAKRGA